MVSNVIYGYFECVRVEFLVSIISFFIYYIFAVYIGFSLLVVFYMVFFCKVF